MVKWRVLLRRRRLLLLLRRQRIFAYQFDGKRYDAGTPLGLLKAAVELALQHPDLGPEFKEFLRGLQLGRNQRNHAKVRRTLVVGREAGDEPRGPRVADV